MKYFIKSIATVLALLGICFIPFPFNITNAQLQLTDLIFGRCIGLTAKILLGRTLTNTRVYSDSISMYLLLLLIFVTAVILVLILSKIKKWAVYREKTGRIVYQFILYYLVLQLLKYGADKIFKNQFYAPEPNTLFTPIIQLEKDILYWSTIGSSYSYNIFLGGLEIFAGLLVLTKRTRLIGLLLSLGVIVNVIAVNFGFDISVKLFSLFLLFLNVYLLLPYRYLLYQLLLQKDTTSLSVNRQAPLFKKTLGIFFLQWLAVGFIILEVLYPFVVSNNYNSDTTPKPYLHGAYEVTHVIEGNDTLSAAAAPVKRFFIHRDNYIIFQGQQDQMQDYKLQYNKADSSFTITDYQLKKNRLFYTYQSADSILTLQYFTNGKMIWLMGKTIDYTKLPLLKKHFRWTVDHMP